MIDLPANVTFTGHPDDWQLRQDDDLITSVQAFLHGEQIVIELWDRCTLISPAGNESTHEFQQNSWIATADRSWKVTRVVRDVVASSGMTHDGVTFELSGAASDIARARRI